MSIPMALDAADDARQRRLGDRLLATLCLSAAAWLLRLRFGRVLALVRWTMRRCHRPASAGEATRIVGAIRRAARHRSGRVACLEQSLAAVLLAGIHRRSIQWCIGARLMPYAAHAWIEVDGRSIGEPGPGDHPFHVLLRA